MLVLVLASKRLPLAAPRALTYLGDISFSLYLWHPLEQEALSDTLVKAGYGSLTIGFSFLFLSSVIAIVVAKLSHTLLERSLAERMKNSLQRALRARQAVSTKVA